MKRMIVVALLALALPRVAFGAMDVFNNERGTISISYPGIVSKGRNSSTAWELFRLRAIRWAR